MASQPLSIASKRTMAKTTIEAGNEAENMACHYLVKKGLKTLCRNYRCRRGEIDAIMEDDKTIVFVEVRYRKHTQFGSGAESVTHTKQNKLIATALHYLQKHPKYNNRPSRFDVVSISHQSQQLEIDWIQDAFQG